jgi:predicted nucleic acid-binding protein
MLVISDAFPINVLVRIKLIHVLPELYGRVLIPADVAHELGDTRAPNEIREFLASSPQWLEIRAPSTLLDLPSIGLGERAAISLACEIKADLLLIDDRRGRRAARGLNLRVVGTLGVLELAAGRGLVRLDEVFGRMRETDFSVSEELLKAALARDAQRQPRRAN